MGPDRSVLIACEITEACTAATAAGVPISAMDAHHVWLDSEDRVKVGFGLEDVAGLPVSEGDQVRALGALLYLALTGVPAATVRADLRAPRSIDPRIPRDLERVTMRALGAEADDEGTYEDLATFASALTRVRQAAPAPQPAPEPHEHHSVFRSWMLVPLALVVVAGAVIAGGIALGKLEIGGPLGVRPAVISPSPEASGRGGNEGGTARTDEVRDLDVAKIRSYDPFGDDGEEGASTVALAIDGDRTTAWRTENYFDGSLNKPGVGLLLDLGDPATVEKFRLFTDTPGFTYEIRVGDDPRDLVRAHFHAESFKADPTDRDDLARPEVGRYVLFWVTSVADDGGEHRASVAELSLQGLEEAA
jgi:hypothetical protein